MSDPLEHHFKKLPVRECVKHGWIPTIVQTFSCVSVDFRDSVIAWMKPVYGPQGARRRLEMALKSVDRPCHITPLDESPNSPLVVNCFEVAKEKTTDSAMVPCQTEDEQHVAQIRANIYAGDEVMLRSGAIKDWWRVEELREASQTLLLARRHEKPGTTFRIPEYKEISHLQLVGCLVKRHDYFPRNNVWAADYHAVDEPKITFYFQLPACNPEAAKQALWDLLLQARKAFPLETASAHASDAADTAAAAKDPPRPRQEKPREERGLSPKRVSEGARAQLQVWSARRDEEIRARALLARADPSIASADPALWTLVVRSLKAVCRGERGLLFDLSAWTLAGGGMAAVKAATSRGAGDERDDGDEERNRRRAVDAACKKAWSCQRPYTNCDQPVIARARGFLRAHGMDDVLEYMDDDGNVDLTGPKRTLSNTRKDRAQRKTHRDHLAEKVLQDARRALSDIRLVFHAAPVSTSEAGMRVSSTPPTARADNTSEPAATTASRDDVPAAVQVPCVVNEFLVDDPLAPAEATLQGSAASTGKDKEKMLNDRVISSGETEAFIAEGDIVYVEDLSPSIHGASRRRTEAERSFVWLQVLKVDLLFARLRVKHVQAPPMVWLLERQKMREGQADGSGDGHKYGAQKKAYVDSSSSRAVSDEHWLPVANLWNVLVSRKGPDEGSGPIHYLTFMTPIPHPGEALAVLGRLPRRITQKERRDRNQQLCAIAPKASCHVQILRATDNALLVGWTVQDGGAPEMKNGRQVVGHTCAVLVCPCLYEHSSRMPWIEVYRGGASACQVGALLPATSYHIKVVKLDAPSIAVHLQGAGKISAHVMATTLASQPTMAPAIVEWAAGMKAGSVRVVVAVAGCDPTANVWDDETRRRASAAAKDDLPPGCHYTLEACIPARRAFNPLTKGPIQWPDAPKLLPREPKSKVDAEDEAQLGFDPRISRSLDEDVKMSHVLATGISLELARDGLSLGQRKSHPQGGGSGAEVQQEQEWITVAHGQEPYLQCIGAWAGKEVYLRARILNCDSQASEPSPVAMVTAPAFA